jgi:hypothetical protein
MKQVLFLCLIFISVVSKSQTPFNVEYEADYKLVYKDQNIPNAPTQDAAFALLMNREESYFKNLNKYVSDSLKYERKLNDKSSYNDY